MASSLKQIFRFSPLINIARFSFKLFSMSWFHCNMVALQLIVFFCQVYFVGNGRFFWVALIIHWCFWKIWFNILEATEMTPTLTTFAHTKVRIMMAEIGSEKFTCCLLEIPILEGKSFWFSAIFESWFILFFSRFMHYGWRVKCLSLEPFGELWRPWPHSCSLTVSIFV